MCQLVAAPSLDNVPDALQFMYSIPDQRLVPLRGSVTPRNEGTDETLTWSLATDGTWFAISPQVADTPASHESPSPRPTF